MKPSHTLSIGLLLGALTNEACGVLQDNAEASSYSSELSNKETTVYPCGINIDDGSGVDRVNVNWLSTSESSVVGYKQAYVDLSTMTESYVPIPWQIVDGGLFRLTCGFTESNAYFGDVVRTEIW